MTCREFLEKYISDGRGDISELECSMVRGAVMRMLSINDSAFYQRAKEDWKADEEPVSMPEDIESEPVICAEDIYVRIPSYMVYETCVGSKEKYNAILSFVKQVREGLYVPEKGLCYDLYDKSTKERILETGDFLTSSAAFYLMGMADIMSAVSEEIFEQYKQYVAFFKEGVNGMLQYYKEGQPLFPVYAEQELSDENPEDIHASLMVAYVLFQGCVRRALLPEKYQPIAENIFKACLDRLAESNTYEEAAGELALTYTEYVALLQKQGTDITKVEL